MKQFTETLRGMLLVAACLTMIALVGCGRTDNQPERPGSSGTTSDNSATRDADRNIPNSGSPSDNATPGTASQPADRDQTGATARRGGTGDITTGTGNEMSGGTVSETDLTQRIRRTLRQDNSFTNEVTNLKIAVSNGLVTLRGPVSTQQMKDRIESRVKEIAGVKSVDNQLQVTNSGQ